ncbi:MAG: hypothetical protein AVDCRST_MAG76-1749, partial [uncultured Acidimicrobiales bacterium]
CAGAASRTPSRWSSVPSVPPAAPWLWPGGPVTSSGAAPRPGRGPPPTRPTPTSSARSGTIQPWCWAHHRSCEPRRPPERSPRRRERCSRR